MIYGTVRLIERDDETFLAWARDRYACVIFNLHVEHTPPAIDAAAAAFRDLIDLGIQHGGSYYLTYHRWARKDQVERCYPQIRGIPRAEAAPRSGRSLPEQLVTAIIGRCFRGCELGDCCHRRMAVPTASPSP